MARLRYSFRLLREFTLFARYHKAYWIVPLIVLLGLFALLGGSIQSAGTLLIYTLF